MLRNPFFIKVAARAAKLLLKAIFLTLRIEVKGLENLNSKEKLILMLWHNRIAMTPEILTRYTKSKRCFSAFVSNSRDGAYLAAIIESYKRGKTIRVPHDLRHDALKQVIKQLRATDDIVVITPDGPRGPRYEVKGGIALAAKQAGAQIVPMSWNASRFWQFNSWDKFMLPKPFSKLTVDFGEPINLSSGKLQDDTDELQKALLDLAGDV